MYTYVDSIEDLSFLSKELLTKPVLAVDTEFRRTTKDNMRLALLQINDGEEIYIIDTVILNDPKDHCDFLFRTCDSKRSFQPNDFGPMILSLAFVLHNMSPELFLRYI